MSTKSLVDQAGSLHVNDFDDGRHLLDILLRPMDAWSQLIAIGNTIGHHRVAERLQDKDIATLAAAANSTSDADVSDDLAGTHNYLLGMNFFDQAAHSMAAVGVITPFLETVYYRFFTGLATIPTEKHLIPPTHERKRMARCWDCHYIATTQNKIKTDVVIGIRELADATGVTAYLPTNASLVLSALFRYRNAMFHNGFEWTVKELDSFRVFLDIHHLPKEWFDISTCNDQPWIIYMSTLFVDLCLNTAAAILDGMGRFLAIRCTETQCLEWWTEKG